jgi:uncharacterized membrane protein YdjX (TVP38/TMEM64 family)
MRRAKVALVAVVATLLVAAHQFGVLEQFAEPAQLRDTLVGLGVWGYAAFVLSYTLLQPFGVPGTVFVMAAPLIWSWPVAYALSMTGTMLASIVGFSFARFVARDWVAERIPKRFQRYDQALAERGFSTVVLLRFVFWMPPMLHAFFGVSRVPFATHVWGSIVGYAIPLFLVSFFGQELFDFLYALPVAVWVAVGVSVLLIALSIWLWRRKRRRQFAERVVPSR